MQCVFPGSPQEKKCFYLWACPDGGERLAFMKAAFSNSRLPRYAAKTCPLPPHRLRKKQYLRQQISTFEARVP